MIKDERKPKRPWSTEKDGDLWETFCEIAKQKGPNSIKKNEVKGHATNKNVEDGVATWKDKRGNDRADRAADEGVKTTPTKYAKLAKYKPKGKMGT